MRHIFQDKLKREKVILCAMAMFPVTFLCVILTTLVVGDDVKSNERHQKNDPEISSETDSVSMNTSCHFRHQPFVIPLVEEDHYLIIWREESSGKLYFALNPVTRRNEKLTKRDWKHLIDPSFRRSVNSLIAYAKNARHLPDFYHGGLCLNDPDFCYGVQDIPVRKTTTNHEHMVIMNVPESGKKWLTFPSVFDENVWNDLMSPELLDKINMYFSED